MSKYLLALSFFGLYLPQAMALESQHVEVQQVTFRYFCKDGKHNDNYLTSPTFKISDDFYQFNVAPSPDYDVLKKTGELVVTDESGQKVSLGTINFASLCAGHKNLDAYLPLNLKETYAMEAFLSYDGKCVSGTWTEGEGKYVTGWAVDGTKQVVTLKSNGRTFRFENSRYFKQPGKIFKTKALCQKAGEDAVRRFPN